MSILIIGNRENPHVQKLQSELQDLADDIIIFPEIGRCILPLKKEFRIYIDSEGKRGQELAKKAARVYLVREEKVERIK